MVAFVMLGIILVFEKGTGLFLSWFPETFQGKFIFVTNIIVWIVVAMNLIRGIPVLWDGRYYLFERSFPRQLKDDITDTEIEFEQKERIIGRYR